MTTSHERMTAGYAKTPKRKIGRAPFLLDQRLERLLVLRSTDPATFTVLGPTTRTELGYYEASRTAAGYTGEETTP